MARRNRLAREYSMQAHQRRKAAVQMLEMDVAPLRVAREVIEMAPANIAHLMLSGDMRGLVLYANANACGLLVGVMAARKEVGLLGRYVVHAMCRMGDV